MSSDLSLFEQGRVFTSARFEGKDDAAADTIAGHILAIKENTKNEPGCYVYRVHRFGRKIFVYEEYENAAAIREHESSEIFLKFKEVFPSLIVGPPEIEYYREL